MRKFILEKAKETALDEKITLVSGVALGVDTVFALVALKLKREFPDKFRLECAVPCKNHEARWSKEDKNRYHEILKQADKVINVSQETYKRYLMTNRDKYMIQSMDREEKGYVFAVWDGKPYGGTYKTVCYAREGNKLIYIHNPFNN